MILTAPPPQIEGRCHAFAWRGGVRWLALANCHRITPPTQGLPPWASPRLALGSRPHAYRQAREAVPPAVARAKFTWRLLGIIDAFFGVSLRFDAQRDFY